MEEICNKVCVIPVTKVLLTLNCGSSFCSVLILFINIILVIIMTRRISIIIKILIA